MINIWILINIWQKKIEFKNAFLNIQANPLYPNIFPRFMNIHIIPLYPNIFPSFMNIHIIPISKYFSKVYEYPYNAYIQIYFQSFWISIQCLYPNILPRFLNIHTIHISKYSSKVSEYPYNAYIQIYFQGFWIYPYNPYIQIFIQGLYLNILPRFLNIQTYPISKYSSKVSEYQDIPYIQILLQGFWISLFYPIYRLHRIILLELYHFIETLSRWFARKTKLNPCKALRAANKLFYVEICAYLFQSWHFT